MREIEISGKRKATIENGPYEINAAGVLLSISHWDRDGVLMARDIIASASYYCGAVKIKCPPSEVNSLAFLYISANYGRNKAQSIDILKESGFDEPKGELALMMEEALYG